MEEDEEEEWFIEEEWPKDWCVWRRESMRWRSDLSMGTERDLMAWTVLSFALGPESTDPDTLLVPCTDDELCIDDVWDTLALALTLPLTVAFVIATGGIWLTFVWR